MVRRRDEPARRVKKGLIGPPFGRRDADGGYGRPLPLAVNGAPVNPRRTVAVLVSAVLPLTLVAAPAQAAWTVGKGRPTSEWVEGGVASVDITTNTIVLTDGRVLEYDGNDVLNTFQLHDVVDAGEVGCDLADRGGEENLARFVAKGMEVSLSATVYRPKKAVTFFHFEADTCDGALTPADAM